MKFIIWLKCEHCNNDTILFDSLNKTDSICSYSECRKTSKINELTKNESYIRFLEEKVILLENKNTMLTTSLNKFINEDHLVETANGSKRLIKNTFSSIQWAINPMKFL